jgi:D-sedoheptulose 7-phosphate isomerase
MSSHVESFFSKISQVAEQIDTESIEDAVQLLAEAYTTKSRVFVLGVGGSAGNASHMVNDLRKLCGLEAYAPTDNVSELTARTNDEGWETVFSEWLKVSNLDALDVIVVLSVGGGNKERKISMNLVNAIRYAQGIGCNIISIVGRSDGYAAKKSTCTILIPEVDPALVTPISEGYQAIVWHSMVSHPDLQVKKTTW